MIHIKGYLNLIVLGPLLTTIFAFLLGITFVLGNFGSINIWHSLLFLIVALLMHMFTNVTDNLEDYKKAVKHSAHGFIENTRVKGLSITKATRLDIALAILIAVLGIYLVFITTYWLLLIGLWGFGVAFFYSAGKHSLSTTRFGDFASGFTMGIGITFACILINVPLNEINLGLLITAIIASGLTIFSITNMVLANNICDEQDDIDLHRMTIVARIGKDNALKLYAAYYVLMYVSIVVSVIFQWLPWTMLLVLISIPKVWNNTKIFFKKQVKTETFGLTVQNINWFLTLTTIALVIYAAILYI
ncbi:prenyltransferase [Apilactobacillus micheneri]|uniref:prenyltransferase n=1 Tax=Apilactobacillus micheneri TaxID=1899430 RepID=UPI001127AE71|nr:prenyltransferase [Apilactobacillus micheneri]TPR50412.1 prenyltransferase [Apilactobacillus micheneri]